MPCIVYTQSYIQLLPANLNNVITGLYDICRYNELTVQGCTSNKKEVLPDLREGGSEKIQN